jgi:hypothetical protein
MKGQHSVQKLQRQKIKTRSANFKGLHDFLSGVYICRNQALKPMPGRRRQFDDAFLWTNGRICIALLDSIKVGRLKALD